jgi:hypothetical protein
VATATDHARSLAVAVARISASDNLRQKPKANAKSTTAVRKDEDEDAQPKLHNPALQDVTEMQPFERIKPPSQSMDGPITYARAQRGEIPMRGGANRRTWSNSRAREVLGTYWLRMG